MDRKDFIEQLFLMYPKSYCEANASIWRKAYEDVLPLTTNFDGLMRAVIGEYSANTIPKPAWFKSRSEVIEATRAANIEFDRKAPFITKSLFVEINGRVYEFGYDPRKETEEQVVRALCNRFHDRTITFKDKKEVFGNYNFNPNADMKSFDAI